MTQTLLGYSEYRDSKLSWLGSIPSHWETRRCRYLFREIDVRSEHGKETHLSMTQTRGLIPSSDLDKKRLQSESYAGGKLCRHGDLVLNRLKAHLGVFAHAPTDGVVSPDYTVLRPINGARVLYYEHLFKSHAYVGELRRRTKGIVEGFWRLYTPDFYDIPALFPPPYEQDYILRFINYYDHQIKSLIREKQRLIDLLNEQKQTIIHRAVMRGLNPDVSLKSSGTKWLGDVPCHWEIRPLKYWTYINKEVLPESTAPDYRFRYLDIGSVGTRRLFREPQSMRFDEAPSRARRVVRRFDTLISTVRTYLRAVYFVKDDEKDLIASTGFAVLTPRKSVYPEFLSLVVQSNAFIDRVTAYSVGIAYPAIAETVLGSFHLAFPPTISEQEAIVAWIQKEIAPVDTALEQAQSELALIREYRARLISDVVIGQLDLRHWEPPPVYENDMEEEPLKLVDEMNLLAVESAEEEVINGNEY
jgi:type I restriction enzyme S subunit